MLDLSDKKTRPQPGIGTRTKNADEPPQSQEKTEALGALGRCRPRRPHLPFFAHLQPVRSCALEVVIQDNESLDRALRRFKRKVQRSGLYSELRKRRYYEKPSAQRKRKREAAIRRERRRQRRTRR